MTRPLDLKSVVAIACESNRLAALWVEGQDGEARIRTSVTAETGRLEEGLPQLVEGLKEAGRHPRDAVLLTDRATAICLDLPPHPPERKMGLVQYEIDPFLPADAGHDGPDSLACGWADAQEGPVFASAVPKNRCQAWERIFEEEGMRLQAIYPALACGAALFPDRTSGTILETIDGRTGTLELVKGAPTRFRIRDEAGDGASLVHLSTDGRSTSSSFDGPGPASLRGAARHALGLKGADRVPAIAVREPVPPLHQRPLAVALLLLLLVGSGIGLFEAWAASRLDNLERTVASLEEKSQTLQAEQNRRKQVETEAKELTGSLSNLDEERTALRERVRILKLTERRNPILSELLRGIPDVTPSDLAVDAIEETDETGLRIRGFSLTELSAQEFLRRLQELLGRYGLESDSPFVQRRKGRLEVDGYHFEFRFRPGGKETM